MPTSLGVEAVRRYDALGMARRSAAARGAMRGGDAGAAEAQVACDHVAAQGVVDPRRFAATLAPSLLLGSV